MKILLDQSAPRNLAHLLQGDEVKHTAQLGWEEIVNGTLLKLAVDNGYDLLITADQNLPYQQKSDAYTSIGILALSTNNWNLLKPHIPTILAAIEQVKRGEIVNVFVGKFVPSRFRKTDA